MCDEVECLFRKSHNTTTKQQSGSKVFLVGRPRLVAIILRVPNDVGRKGIISSWPVLFLFLILGALLLIKIIAYSKRYLPQSTLTVK